MVKRVACVVVPALALQLLLRRLQLAATQPVAVIDHAPHEHAMPSLQWINQAARHQGLQRGMRLSEARSLCPNLHADCVDSHEVGQGVQDLWQHLLRFTPAVEPDMAQAGVFWLDPNGLHDLFGPCCVWAAAVHDGLSEYGYHNTVAVGFNRYCTYAMACALPNYGVARHGDDERARAERVALGRLHWPPSQLDALQKLGVVTLGQFMRLPEAEVKQRLGSEAYAIHRLVQRRTPPQVEGKLPVEPVVVDQLVEPPDACHERLLFGIKGMLQPLCASLRARGEDIVVLRVRLQMSLKQHHDEALRPAEPTLCERVLIDLVRLRLGTVTLCGPVEAISITAETALRAPHQATLLSAQPQRNLTAAARALAQVKAAMGDDACVTRACLGNSNLPEQNYFWQPTCTVEPPRSTPVGMPPLVRQVFPSFVPMPPRPPNEPELWLGPQYGAIQELHGPYRIQQGWWHENIDRDYYYLQTRAPALVWVAYHRQARRWFMHGVVD